MRAMRRRVLAAAGAWTHIVKLVSTTKDEGQGTVLGLAMLYEVTVQSHGGVQAASQLGRGGTLTLLLPRVA